MWTQHPKVVTFFWLLILLQCVLSCGVKGPPLPPLPVTPEQSDRVELVRPSPVPYSSHSPTPR